MLPDTAPNVPLNVLRIQLPVIGTLVFTTFVVPLLTRTVTDVPAAPFMLTEKANCLPLAATDVACCTTATTLPPLKLTVLIMPLSPSGFVSVVFVTLHWVFVHAACVRSSDHSRLLRTS